MTNEQIIFLIIVSVIVIGGCLIAFLIAIHTKPDNVTNELPEPRIVLPTDSDIYTFSLNSQLKPEEWQMILNAGWSFLTCTTEQYVDYAGCFPEAPSFYRTRWNYVFRRIGNDNACK